MTEILQQTQRFSSEKSLTCVIMSFNGFGIE